MIKRWLATTVALTAALALAGCVTRGVRTEGTASGEEKLVLNPITRVCPKFAAIPVIKITITDLSPKHMGNEIGRYNSNEAGTSALGESIESLPPALLDTRHKTKLDIDARRYLKREGDVLRIEIELGDKDASFFPGSQAITSGNRAGDAMFCIKSAADRIVAKPGDRKLGFYVQYLESQTLQIGKYNIFLVAKDGAFEPYETPILLDPKVGNNG